MGLVDRRVLFLALLCAALVHVAGHRTTDRAAARARQRSRTSAASLLQLGTRTRERLRDIPMPQNVDPYGIGPGDALPASKSVPVDMRTTPFQQGVDHQPVPPDVPAVVRVVDQNDMRFKEAETAWGNNFPDGPLRPLPSAQPPPLAPSGRWLHTMVRIESDLWVFGGVGSYNDKLYNDLWLYNFGDSKWFELHASYIPPFPARSAKRMGPQGPLAEYHPTDSPPAPPIRDRPIKEYHTELWGPKKDDAVLEDPVLKAPMQEPLRNISYVPIPFSANKPIEFGGKGGSLTGDPAKEESTAAEGGTKFLELEEQQRQSNARSATPAQQFRQRRQRQRVQVQAGDDEEEERQFRRPAWSERADWPTPQRRGQPAAVAAAAAADSDDGVFLEVQSTRTRTHHVRTRRQGGTSRGRARMAAQQQQQQQQRRAYASALDGSGSGQAQASLSKSAFYQKLSQDAVPVPPPLMRAAPPSPASASASSSPSSSSPGWYYDAPPRPSRRTRTALPPRPPAAAPARPPASRASRLWSLLELSQQMGNSVRVIPTPPAMSQHGGGAPGAGMGMGGAASVGSGQVDPKVNHYDRIQHTDTDIRSRHSFLLGLRHKHKKVLPPPGSSFVGDASLLQMSAEMWAELDATAGANAAALAQQHVGVRTAAAAHIQAQEQAELSDQMKAAAEAHAEEAARLLSRAQARSQAGAQAASGAAPTNPNAFPGVPAAAGSTEKTGFEHPMRATVPFINEDLWRYDLDTKLWSNEHAKSPNVPAPRWLHSAVVIDGCMVVFGGVSYADIVLGDIWVFSPEDLGWVKALPTGQPILPREGHSAVTMNQNEMWVFGGISYGHVPFNDLYVYQAAANQWVIANSKGSAPSPRWMHTAVVYVDETTERMIIFGGITRNWVPLDDVHIFNKATATWSHPVAQGFPPFPRFLHVAEMIHDKMFVIGGMANNMPLEDIWIYDFDKNVWIEEYATGPWPFAREGAAACVVTPPEPNVKPDERRKWVPEDPVKAGLDPLMPLIKNYTTPVPLNRYRKDYFANRFIVIFGGAGPKPG